MLLAAPFAFARRVSAALLLVIAAGPLSAIEPVEDGRPPRLLRAFDAPDLTVGPTLDELGDLRAASRPGLTSFRRDFGNDWTVRWDRRSDRPHILQGSGVAIVPGRGNGLLPADLGLSPNASITLDDVALRLQAFVAAYPEVLAVENFDLRLDRARSVGVGADNSHWFVEFAQYQNGVPVEGANVFFRLSQGNLVQFGADKVAPVTTATVPALGRDAAFALALRELGVASADLEEVIDGGTLRLAPAMPPGGVAGERFVGTAGNGYDHRLEWKFVFRLQGEATTYQVLLDAHRNQVIAVDDLNAYADATVSGGIFPTTNTDAEVVVNFPFATLTNGATKITNAAGIYNYDPPGSTATIALNGQFFQMSDACGAISLSNSTDGNLALGSSAGTDCVTPGVGGAGNTHSSRSGFYHLTKINRKGATFLPATAWLNTKVTANMNINLTCNAFWNGSTLNFYRSGGGCSNTGELAAVFLHEWGHGLDTNTGGSAANDQGSGEAVGDTFAFLETRDGCIGQNFRPGTDCFNCNACTGVRDVSDFDLSGPAVIARPSNVTHDLGINCDRYLTTGGAINCPYRQNGGSGALYRGVMGYEGHCESVIQSSANWDLTQKLVDHLGTNPGWAAMDAIWYKSLTPSKSAYQVTSGGTCNAAASVDGCAATNWYTVFLPADDDDGNLANGTPNACRIWDAYSAHGIACGARPVCSGCATTVVANAGADVAICSGGSTTIGTPGVAGLDYLWSPGGETTAQILVSPTADTTYTLEVSNACDELTDSVTVTVGHAPAAPALVSPTDGAVGVNPPIVLTWSATPDATSYFVELATDGAFTNVVGSTTTTGTSADFGGRPLGPYFWRVTPVGSCPGGVTSAIFVFVVNNGIFVDGFDSGTVGAWSLAVP